MPKYRLKTGYHIHNGKEYKAGEIIECESDLRKVFREKFELVHESAAAPVAPEAPVKAPSEPASPSMKASTQPEEMEWPNEDEAEKPAPKSKRK